MRPIWVVDDDRSIRWVLEKALTRAGMPLRLFQGAREVLEALKTDTPSVLLSDIRMHDMTGVELLAQVKAQHPEIPVIIMTAFGDLDSAVSAFQGGAYEYLAKPFDLNRAIELLKRACEENNRSQSPDDPAVNPSQETTEIIGQSPAMQEVFRAIGRLSQSHVTVLLTGESGTGKEVVARALHQHSPRRNAPFVAINMAAIPRELLESELFGHERGAFTGASSLQYGRFEQAKGGTLFLDEIGDMPMELQTRLLRVLSDGCFYRVGGRESIRADVRVIAATNLNLGQRVRGGLFREDLFHRLNVIHLRLPALRDRPEDVAALAEHFLRRSAEQLKTERRRLADETVDFLQQFDFPGNVRQLENLCHWITVMAPSQIVRVDDLPEEIKSSSLAEELPAALRGDWTELLAVHVREALQQKNPQLMAQMTREFERVVYRTALDSTHGRKVEAAQKLGVGRNTLTRKLSELNM